MTQSKDKLSFNGTWSMAVGGMIGGGIFSTLGVVVSIAGPRAWLSFLTAGLIALAAGYSYVKLAVYYGEGAEPLRICVRSMPRRSREVFPGYSSLVTC